MALSGFWDRIRSLYRRLTPSRAPKPTYAPSVPRPPPTRPGPVAPIPPPVAPPAGPLDEATILDNIAQAGRQLKLLQITYDGVTRMVEPYSMRDRSTGRQFYGYCSVHSRIHSFIPSKITQITVTNITFSPRWPVEFI